MVASRQTGHGIRCLNLPLFLMNGHESTKAKLGFRTNSKKGDYKIRLSEFYP
jgi:hypothetical protein